MKAHCLCVCVCNSDGGKAGINYPKEDRKR